MQLHVDDVADMAVCVCVGIDDIVREAVLYPTHYICDHTAISHPLYPYRTLMHDGGVMGDGYQRVADEGRYW